MAEPAVHIAERYAALVNDCRTDAVAELFAEDAVFLNPFGVALEGREAIRAFYEDVLPREGPRIRVARTAVDGDDCWAELELETADSWTLVTASHFTLAADGSIARLAVFLRPRDG